MLLSLPLTHMCYGILYADPVSPEVGLRIDSVVLKLDGTAEAEVTAFKVSILLIPQRQL